MKIQRSMVTGAVIAGGEGRRMGDRDKGLIPFRGIPLFIYAVRALAEVADTVLINANRNLEEYRSLDRPVVTDGSTEFQGPLAGILAAMTASKTPYLLTLPCDVPLIDAQMLTRLLNALADQPAEVSVAHDGQRLHPVVMAVECRLADDLRAYLASGERKVQSWLNRHRCAIVDFSDRAERLGNLNTPEDLLELAQKP